MTEFKSYRRGARKLLMSRRLYYTCQLSFFWQFQSLSVSHQNAIWIIIYIAQMPSVAYAHCVLCVGYWGHFYKISKLPKSKLKGFNEKAYLYFPRIAYLSISNSFSTALSSRYSKKWICFCTNCPINRVSFFLKRTYVIKHNVLTVCCFPEATNFSKKMI